MAIQRIPGSMLESNLVREGVDLAFQTNLLYLDVNNNRLGVGTDAPGYTLDVNGLANFRNDVTITGDLTVNGTTTTVDSQNLVVEDNLLLINSNNSAATDAGIMINRGGANDPAVLYWDESLDVFRVGTTTSDGSTRQDLTGVTLAKIQAADPVGDDDLVTKRYFAANASSIADGQALPLGTPGDFSDTNSNTVETSFTDGAYTQIGSADSVTEAIAALNETMENIREGTYVQTVDFTADVTTGSAGLVVTLTITHVGGGADRYNIDWGDGNVTTATSDSTPTHTYSSNVGSPFSVTVRAYANSAVTNSAGSFATKTRTNYIVIYTAAPATNFFIYVASSGGSAITKTDSGSTIYLENTSTNTTSATVTYEVDWGDGNSDTIASDSASGGVSGSRLSHTYTNSAADDGSTVAGTGAGDTRYRIRLTLLTHSTADPAEIPKSTDKNFDVYSTHTPKIDIADSTLRGINEQSTSGFPVTFINGTDTNPGSQSVFTSNIYSWDFGEGASATNVNVGSGGTGDTGQTIANTFNLSSGEQAAGTTQTYNVQLSLATGHSTTPFQSAITQIVVEPDVRANIAGTAVTVSDRTGDNQYDLYDFTDLSGNNRAVARFTNTSQNADDYFYDYFDDSSSTALVTEDGSSPGSIGATIDKDYAGTGAGNINFRFRAHGTPDTIEQDDEETLTFSMNATPAAPSNLSTFSLTLSTTTQGTNPKLCAGFDDASDSGPLSAGASLNTTTARRYSSTTPINTNVVNNAYNGASGTLTAIVNGVDSGNKTFTTATGENGTFTSLVVSDQGDAHTTISAVTYPTNFYQTFDAKITQALSSYSVGVNDQRLEHSATGNTTYVSVVRDDITDTPTTSVGTVAEGTAGTYRYVSGVPYYDAGDPTITITGTTVANFTGQAYQDTTSPHVVAVGTVSEGSGTIFSSKNFTYAQVDGASTMLTGGIPNVDTGVASPYTLGTLSVTLSSASAIYAVSTIKAQTKNCNGTGAYDEDTTKIQVFTQTPGGLNQDQGGIIVSDSLGVTYDDDAVRISGLGSASDTPSFSNADYYTNNAWNGAVTVAGTQEAIVRPTGTSAGTIQHDTTDYSSGYLPVGPDRSSDTGAQYYTFAFRRANVANFTVTLTGTVSGFYIAAPGTAIDSTSTLNGWIDASIAYAGSGVPGANTGAGGNGSNGCAFTSGDRIIDGTTYSAQSFTLTLGSENASNATGNNILVRIKLESGDSVTALSIA